VNRAQPLPSASERRSPRGRPDARDEACAPAWCATGLGAHPLRVLWVVSDIGRARAFEWVAERSRQWRGLELDFVFLGDPGNPTARRIADAGGRVTELPLRGKADWPRTLMALTRAMRRRRPAVVHTHLFQANVLGLTAARLAGVPHRMYTRHHATLHHRYHPKGVYWDRYCNASAHRIVSISGVVAQVLVEREDVPPHKLAHIPHGFDLAEFATPDPGRAARFRARHGVPADARVIGLSSRYLELKGVEYAVRAFRGVHAAHPDTHLLLLNAAGPHAPVVRGALATLPPGSFTEVGFDEDLPAAYGTMACFVHVPVDPDVEAFGQVYVEALAAGVPSVFTLSGIAPECVRHDENALVVPHRDAAAVEAALLRLLTDAPLRDRLRQQAPGTVRAAFGVDRMTDALRDLYLDTCGRATA
jgi:glycosyltransferase involved in cell wall biosynthesis